MRNFLITLLVSTVATIVLWSLGVAAMISPEHPFLTTIILAAACGIAAQLLGPRMLPAAGQ